MLRKLINGRVVDLTDQEEKQVQATWDFNAKYPHYQWAYTEKGLDIPRIRQMHLDQVERARIVAKERLDDQIEIALEEGKDPIPLYQQRRNLRRLQLDLTKYETIDEIAKCIPLALAEVWSSNES